MKKQFFSALKYVVMLGVGIGLLALALQNFDLRQAAQQASHTKISFILLAFVAAVLSHWSRGARWNLLIRPMGYKVSDRNSFFAVMIGYLANMAIPRLGEVSRCLVLNRTNKIPVDKLIGTVVAERVIDMLCLGVLLILTLILEFDKLKTFLVTTVGNKFSSYGFLTVAKIVMLLTFLVVFLFIVWFIYRRYKDAALAVKIRTLLKGIGEGLQSVRKMEKAALFIFHSFFIWTMYFLMVYICFLAVSATTKLSLGTALSTLVTGSLGFVMPVQGGIGTYEFAVGETLKLYGIGHQDAYTFALIAHTFQLAVILMVGALSLFAVSVLYRKPKIQDDTPAPDKA